MREYEHIYYLLTMMLNIRRYVKAKTVPLHATEALGWRGGIALTHSRPRHYMGVSSQRHAT
jgi:hypothetical protein